MTEEQWYGALNVALLIHEVDIQRLEPVKTLKRQRSIIDVVERP